MNEFSDYIPILIAVGFGVYQLFRFLSKGNSTPGQRPKSTPPPTDPFGGKRDETWDELLEALGQKPKQDHSRPVQPPPPPARVEPVRPKPSVQPRTANTTPPPAPRAPAKPTVFKSSPPVIPKAPKTTLPPPQTIPVEEPSPFEYYQPQLHEEVAARFKSYEMDIPTPPPTIPGFSTQVLSSSRATNLRRLLSDRERLRETIVLREILDKPLSLR